MFHLETPITSSRPVSDFDDISTILTHSSLTGSQKSAPWQQHVGEDGHVFYVELSQASPPPPHSTRTRPATDTGVTCALCSTRSCRSCASEDTGYSSDTDALPSHSRARRWEHSALDLSSDSLFNSRPPDFEDKDDGVSVDLLEFDRPELTQVSVVQQFCEEEEDGGSLPLAHRCSGVGSGLTSCHHQSWSRTASLCERHSNKLYVPENGSDLGSVRKACHCGGQPVPMSSSRTKESACEEVVLHLKPREQAWDSRADRGAWLEAALGIVPGHVDTGSRLKPGNPDSSRIIITGLVPGGPAAKSKKLFVGDCIETINSKQVRWSNLNTVISCLHQTKKVRLSVVRLSSSPQPESSSRLLLNTCSVLQALREHTPPPSPPPTSTPIRPRRGGGDGGMEGVCVLYMSMEGVGSEEEEGEGGKSDVVYLFPKDQGALSSLRGAFFTLDHLLSEGSSSAVESDVRMLTVGVDGCDVHGACHKEGKDMLIVTAPGSRLLSTELLTISNEILRLVRLLYGSVEEAFSSQHHHGSLDDYLSFIFTSLQHNFRGQHTRWKSPLLDYMDYLPLPEDVGVSISNTLTEYESADFADMSDSYYGCRRSFTVLGSMAFYKGRVTCSHLSSKDAGDVGVYLKYSGVLDLSTCHSLHQVLMWREVFPSRLCHEVAALNSVFGYSEPHARWFLMVVGVNNSLLACVLEAGGCAAKHDGMRLPDPFHVDQARAALLHLQTPDIISACETRLTGDGLPATTTADKLLSMESNHRGLDSLLKTTSSLVQSLHNAHVTSGVTVPGSSATVGSGLRLDLSKDQRKLSIESDGSSGSGGSNDGMLFKNRAKRGRMFPLPTHNGLTLKAGVGLDTDFNTCKLTSGRQSTLLMFCQVNKQEGVLITSPVDKMSASSVHRQVVDNFSCCVSRMHADFALTTSAKIYPSEGLLENIHGDHSWSSCREEGVMFTCSLADRMVDGKRSPNNTLVYWVVGRKLRNLQSREVYVCFQDATPQNIIELAFRLALGSSTSM